MSFRRLCLALAALLLSACGQAISAPPTQTLALPTAAVARQPAIALPTPNHQLIDTPILDDLSATAQPSTPTPPAPTATAQPAHQAAPNREATRVVIDDIALDQPLVPVGLDDDTTPIVPKHNVGWFTYSAAPGQGENIVLWGHALRFRDEPNIPAPFGRLNQLKLGARIVLYDNLGKSYGYRITHQLWVTPDQVNYILPTGKERVTMVSCIGDQVIGRDGAVVNMTHRLITIAEPKA
ncbi:MAG TPA: class F sortase [Roseiflexaceae bacterium]|nr:class F sortase [Roseiflexaceae bacterium]